MLVMKLTRFARPYKLDSSSMTTSDVKMYTLLLLVLGSSVLCDSSNDYRKRIASESARFPRSPVARIIGGGKATIEEYPFAVSLQNNGTFFGHEVEHFCGGSIIGEKWIITSAQCALRTQIENFHVRAGTPFYYKGGDVHGVETIVVHPLFNEINYDYDYGLVKLLHPIKYDRTKQPIKLPKENQKINDGTLVSVQGWGAARLLGPMSDDLLENFAVKISDENCMDVNGDDTVTGRMFCVAAKTVKPCVGDSGSGIVLNGTIFGVASWSLACAYKYPTAYAAVSEVTNWIAEITGVPRT